VPRRAALEALERLEQDYALVRRTELLPLDAAEQGAVRPLAADLPALWSAQTTTDVDRKRLLNQPWWRPFRLPCRCAGPRHGQ
jgi:hypothetical protein